MDMLTKFTTRVIIFASLYALSVGSAGARGGKFLITSNDDERDLRNKSHLASQKAVFWPHLVPAKSGRARQTRQNLSVTATGF